MERRRPAALHQTVRFHRATDQLGAEGQQHPAVLGTLSLTPASVVFIDDNPVERAAVQAELPGIRVIGADPFLVRRILLWSPETQRPYLTSESRQRESMLRRQIERETEKASLSRSDFLASLSTRVTLWTVPDTGHPSFTRVFELVNKTNQFNTTRAALGQCRIQRFPAGRRHGPRLFGIRQIHRLWHRRCRLPERRIDLSIRHELPRARHGCRNRGDERAHLHGDERETWRVANGAYRRDRGQYAMPLSIYKMWVCRGSAKQLYVGRSERVSDFRGRSHDRSLKTR